MKKLLHQYVGEIKWENINFEQKDLKKIQDILGLDPLLTKVLCANKIHKLKKQEIKQFIHPAKSLLAETSRVTDPTQLSLGLDRLEKALKKDEKVMIHGDSDADGISGTALLVVALRQMGLQVVHDFPIRSKEGHGIQIRIIDEAIKKGCKLMITTDCGTKDVSAIAYAQEKGLDVIVTDHHQIGLELPKACAIINPLLFEKETPDYYLCGAGVAFKFMVAFAKRIEKTYPKKVYQFMLVLGALGTISDRMTFKVAQNRCLVYFGVKEFNKTTLPGLQALLNISKKDKDKVYARDVGRLISPLLNAPGRIGNPDLGIPDSNLVVEFMTYGVIEQEKNIGQKDKKLKQYINSFLKVIELNKESKDVSVIGVSKKAEMVNEVNEERKKITEKIANEIEEILEEKQQFLDDKIIVIKGKNWNSGVIGIDADRLRERFKKPTIIMTEYEGSDYIKASVRSLPSINMYKVLEQIQIEFIQSHQRDPFVVAVDTKDGEKILNSFGGHAQACGFSFHKNDYDVLAQMIYKKSNELNTNDYIYKLSVLEELSLDKVNLNLYKRLQTLNPYGESFDFPIFLLKGLNIGTKIRPFGNKYHPNKVKHVEFYVLNHQVKHPVKCVGFNLWDLFSEVKTKQSAIDVVATLEYRQLRGKKNRSIIQLNVLDMRLSEL